MSFVCFDEGSMTRFAVDYWLTYLRYIYYFILHLN